MTQTETKETFSTDGKPSRLWIKETFVDATQNATFGQGDWYETEHSSIGDLYRALRSEYGACVSKQYSEYIGKPDVQSGWVFRKQMQHEDAKSSWPKEDRYYIREVWVSVSTTPPQKRTVNITLPWQPEVSQ